MCRKAEQERRNVIKVKCKEVLYNFQGEDKLKHTS